MSTSLRTSSIGKDVETIYWSVDAKIIDTSISGASIIVIAIRGLTTLAIVDNYT
jgi:hypothetical protein